MMQRKNKSRSSAAAHHVSSSSSGYDSSSSSNAGAVNDGMLLLPPTATAATTMTIPSTSPSLSMSMSDDDMVGKSNNKNISIINNNIKHNIAEKVKIATVKRYTCGTRPFDKYWLNLDCCGLICASVTYMLHLYAIYSFGWILLPPWFSIMDEDGYRYLTAGCYLHRLLFIGIAILAIFSHFKAMTTDPGAVPPDAHPLSEKEEGEKTRGDWEYEKLDNLIKGEGLHHTHHPHSHHQSFQQQHQLQPTSSANSAINNNHVEQGTAGGIGSNIGANRRMEHSLISSSSLMQEEPEPLDDSKWNNIELPQAAASATATAAVVAASAISTGGVAIAGLVAMAGAGMGASNGSTAAGGEGWEERPGGPCEENFIHSPSSLHHQQQQQRGQRMCRRCHAFKPPRAHHCRYVLYGSGCVWIMLFIQSVVSCSHSDYFVLVVTTGSICKRCIIKMDHHCPWVSRMMALINMNA
jgi:ribosomal protein L40E